MSTLTDAASAPKATLASLITLIETDATLPETRRREMASAVRTAAKVFRLEPHMISATPGALRVLINDALPTASGVSHRRWVNVKSLLHAALSQLDPAVIPARSRVGLLPAWKAMLDQPEAEPLRRGLARFSKWCSARDLSPVQVTQSAYEVFYDELAAHCLMRSPREAQQAAGKAWNTGNAAVPGWPVLILQIEDFHKNPSLPWDAFPSSLLEDVEAYLAPRSSKHFNLRVTANRMRDSTIKSKRAAIRQFLTALVEGGRQPACLQTLADIVEPVTAWRGLTVLVDRSNGESTGRNFGMAYSLLSIAKHWVKASQSDIKTLSGYCQELNPRQHGLTAKNRKRLQQFDDPQTLRGLLALPAKMMAEASKPAEPSKAEARTAQLAIAIEILSMAPLRIGNLAALEVGRTLILRSATVGHIIIDRTEVKNTVDLEIPLPAATLKLIAVYLKKFHPLIAPAECRMLFPSSDGGHKRPTVLSDQFRKCVGRRCGVEMNVHLFRHLAAKMYLEAFPGAYGIVRLLLGHKLLQTTIDGKQRAKLSRFRG